METQAAQVECTDDEWRTAIANQDDTAWDELSQRLYRASYKLAQQHLDQLSSAVWQEIAVDSVQNAGLRIVERLDQYQGKGPFLAWCYVIVLNATRDRIRRERHRLRREAEELVDWSAPPRHDFALEVENQLYLDELTEEIFRGVTLALTMREQQVFLALLQDELTPLELAREMETTRNNIDQIWHRARQKVRRHLEQAGYTIQALHEHRIL